MKYPPSPADPLLNRSKPKSGFIKDYEHINDPGGAPSLQAQVDQLGGPTDESKIDSIQNVFLLRADLHESWEDYKFGVNPDVRLLEVFTSQGTWEC